MSLRNSRRNSEEGDEEEKKEREDDETSSMQFEQRVLRDYRSLNSKQRVFLDTQKFYVRNPYSMNVVREETGSSDANYNEHNQDLRF